MAERFTKRQGEYLAFLHLYTRLNKRPPAEADFQAYFGVSAPAVHQMIVTLESQGLIQRTHGKARSIRLLALPETLPELESKPQAGPMEASFATELAVAAELSSKEPELSSKTAFAQRYPNISLWVKKQGWIELGYDYNTDTCARAIDEGGMTWGGGNLQQRADEWMQALETAVEKCVKELGLQ